MASAVDDRVGGEPAGLVRERDALAVERVHRAGGVADDEPGRADVRRDRAAGRQLAAGRRRRTTVSGEMPHRAGAVAQNASISVLVLTSFQPVNVDSRPDADVHGAVAHREDPAVPGQVVAVAVAEVEVALDPRLVVERAGEVAAHRHARAG